MTEQSIKRLTKAHLIDLKNMIKPHSLIEKVLQMMRRCAGRCAGPGPRGLGPHAARRQITRERVDARHREIVEAIGAQPETGF